MSTRSWGAKVSSRAFSQETALMRHNMRIAVQPDIGGAEGAGVYNFSGAGCSNDHIRLSSRSVGSLSSHFAHRHDPESSRVRMVYVLLGRFFLQLCPPTVELSKYCNEPDIVSYTVWIRTSSLWLVSHTLIDRWAPGCVGNLIPLDRILAGTGKAYLSYAEL